MLHFYDKPPVPAQQIHDRLGPARVLESTGIPFVIFAEDALAYVHFVPTAVFDLTILVPDELVQVAVDHLQKELPQYHVTNERSYRMMNKERVCGLPRAIRLKLDDGIDEIGYFPEAILIVPHSHFHFDVRDETQTRGLIPPFDPSNARIRFPTMPAFLNAIVDTIFEPVDGIVHREFRMDYLWVFMSYLVIYNVRSEHGSTYPDTEELLPAAEALLKGIKPENIPFLATFMRTGSGKMPPEMIEAREQAKKARLSQSFKDTFLPSSQLLSIAPRVFPGQHRVTTNMSSANQPPFRRSFTQYCRPPSTLPSQFIFRMFHIKRLIR